MKVGERLLLIFLALAFIATLVCVCACVWSGLVFATVISFVGASVYVKIAVTGVCTILCVLAVRGIFVGIKSTTKPVAVAAINGEGGVYISIDTVSDLAAKAVKKTEGVREIKVRTFMKDGGANIFIKVALAADSVIPEVSKEIQQTVKGDIEALCGLTVKKIDVQVDNSIQTQK
ncbi:MAG: alkaline shock response membrane anchor protein AmaP [Clostridia bacterium]|nr:alkaline shock response membrane anchor protein AmaP [Clostridia bacterium]